MFNFFMTRLQYNQQTWRFFVTIAALGFAIDGVYAVLLNLYLLRLGYGPEFIGQVNGLALVTFAVMGLPAGLLGAKWTSRQMLRVGLGIALIGAALLPMAEFTPQGWQGNWLIVTYALILVGFALYFVNGAPFLMAAVTQEKQNSAFALQSAILSSAAFIGSMMGGIMPEIISRFTDFKLESDPQPYRFTLMVVSVVILIAFIIAMTIKKELEEAPIQHAADEQQPKQKIGAQQYTTAVLMLITVMSVVRFFQVAGVGTAVIYFNVYMDTELGLSSGAIGTIAAIGRLIAIPAALFAPRLIRRWGTGTVAVVGSFATVAFLIPLAIFPFWIAAAIGYIGATAMSSLRFTGFIVYIMEIMPKHQQAVMAGAGEMAAGSSFALMALSGGYILARYGFRDLFLLGALFTFIGTVLFWMHLRTGKTRQTLPIMSSQP
jgi:ACDE family multidrug resistance protein